MGDLPDCSGSTRAVPRGCRPAGRRWRTATVHGGRGRQHRVIRRTHVSPPARLFRRVRRVAFPAGRARGVRLAPTAGGLGGARPGDRAAEVAGDAVRVFACREARMLTCREFAHAPIALP
ncbi:hypothetical protein GCM10010274_26120 [Streptomyces lavendofoliae]|uniref:Uncharacterized protein n=1 Tax=Streptomyces lavendofoliae TaxID=67314 RepID=A0A918HWF6_9ACTN|nr:hypothetical protein GCM10010274_26120 [Streptomyces lavendofoliae]